METAGGSKDVKKGKAKKGKAKAKTSKDSSQMGQKLSPPKLFKTFGNKRKDPVKERHDDDEIHKVLEKYMQKEVNREKEKRYAPGATDSLAKARDSSFPGTAFVVPIIDKQKKPKAKGKAKTSK